MMSCEYSVILSEILYRCGTEKTQPVLSLTPNRTATYDCSTKAADSKSCWPGIGARASPAHPRTSIRESTSTSLPQGTCDSPIGSQRWYCRAALRTQWLKTERPSLCTYYGSTSNVDGSDDDTCMVSVKRRWGMIKR